MSDPFVSTGWVMPSEDAMIWTKSFEIPLLAYPDDCGGPHIWEPMSSTAACDCAYCTYHYRWLECENCMVAWYENGTNEWDSAWRKSLE